MSACSPTAQVGYYFSHENSLAPSITANFARYLQRQAQFQEFARHARVFFCRERETGREGRSTVHLPAGCTGCRNKTVVYLRISICNSSQGSNGREGLRGMRLLLGLFRLLHGHEST